MNAKQRKIADKMRERAELDGSAQLKRLVFEREQFAAEKLAHEKHILTEEARLKEAWNTFASQRVSLMKETEDFYKEMGDHRRKFGEEISKQMDEIEFFKKHPNLIKEILLELELDEDPAVVALNIRKKFGLAIAEW